MRLFLLICGAGLMLAQNVPDALIGRWRTVAVTKGGIGAMYEFKTGGVVLVRPGAIVTGTYKIEGNEMVLPPLMEGGPPNRQTINLANPGRLILFQGKEVSMDLSRVGKQPPGKPTVIGEWVGLREMDGQKLEMRIFFFAGGKSLFLLPFQTQQAKYQIDKGRMTLLLPDGRAAEGPFTLGGGALTIPSVRSGKSTELTRY